jgi:hypothetical protein
MTTRSNAQRGQGLEMFGGPADSPKLRDTGMMSRPTMDPAAPEAATEWREAGGQDVRVLFRQGGEGGFSLVWSWFGPNYVLPRHSHSVDCLYYLLSGELFLGNRRIEAGAGFFVPADAPYAYTAGPDGIEILEFRAADSFDMRISESLPRWERIVDAVRGNRDVWAELETTN